MKNTKNKKARKNIYTLSAMFLIVVFSFSYIICIYKTVILASDSEINNKKISSLSLNINQKEFDYIGKISNIDLDKAIELGYIKNHENMVAYSNINNNSELAIR
jgi:hypothetical protein